MQEWQEMLGPCSQSPLQVAASLCGQLIPLPSSVHAVGWPEGQSCLMCFSSYVKNKLGGGSFGCWIIVSNSFEKYYFKVQELKKKLLAS